MVAESKNSLGQHRMPLLILSGVAPKWTEIHFKNGANIVPNPSIIVWVEALPKTLCGCSALPLFQASLTAGVLWWICFVFYLFILSSNPEVQEIPLLQNVTEEQKKKEF